MTKLTSTGEKVRNGCQEMPPDRCNNEMPASERPERHEIAADFLRTLTNSSHHSSDSAAATFDALALSKLRVLSTEEGRVICSFPVTQVTAVA